MPYKQIYKLIERPNIREYLVFVLTLAAEYSVFGIRIQPDSRHFYSYRLDPATFMQEQKCAVLYRF